MRDDKKRAKKTFYYSDNLNDDFAGTNIKTKIVDENFKYIHENIFWRAISFFLYYVVAFPLVLIFEKLFLGVKFVNRRALGKCNLEGSFIYGNHTGFYDAFTPNLISFPKRNMIVVGPDTVSIKGLRTIVMMLGAIPIAANLRGMCGFRKCIEYHNLQGSNITVYPEAHIWPYYTGVRPFPDTSFYYPVKHNAPTFAFFTAYTKPKGLFSFFRKANATVFVSDPIYPDEGLCERDMRKNLREKVYAFMLEKSKYSTYEAIKYVKVSPKDGGEENEEFAEDKEKSSVQ